MHSNWRWMIIEELDTLDENTQNALSQTQAQTPFLFLSFLKLLAKSKSVDANSGWHSHHILIYQGSVEQTDITHIPKENVIALVPCYLKTHSYGEYVFDHAWAHAYQQHQLPYYPKLVCAVPFTPVSGSRALINSVFAAKGIDEESVFQYINTCKTDVLMQSDASSIHLLFPTASLSESLSKAGMHQRMSVQFVWSNQQYAHFDDFLAQLTSRKRRSIRKERAPFADDAQNGLDIRTLTGDELSQEVVDAFYLCYQQTYFKRSGHAGYLSAQFFEKLLSCMRDSVCIVAAFRQDKMLAGSLFFYTKDALFGRYWGALEDISGLHFECCYYRGIDFAIERGIQTFSPGTQGEHKILRGFRPHFCYSNHSLLDARFDQAVADFVAREAPAIKRYHEQACEVLPYKNTEDASPSNK